MGVRFVRTPIQSCLLTLPGKAVGSCCDNGSCSCAVVERDDNYIHTILKCRGCSWSSRRNAGRGRLCGSIDMQDGLRIQGEGLAATLIGGDGQAGSTGGIHLTRDHMDGQEIVVLILEVHLST